MLNRDVSAYMPVLTLQEYGEKTTGEIAKLNRLRRSLFLVALAVIATGGASLYFDTPYLAGALFVLALMVNQTALLAALEVRMREANWSLALLIQRQSNGLMATRQRLDAVDD